MLHVYSCTSGIAIFQQTIPKKNSSGLRRRGIWISLDLATPISTLGKSLFIIPAYRPSLAFLPLVSTYCLSFLANGRKSVSFARVIVFPAISAHLVMEYLRRSFPEPWSGLWFPLSASSPSSYRAGGIVVIYRRQGRERLKARGLKTPSSRQWVEKDLIPTYEHHDLHCSERDEQGYNTIGDLCYESARSRVRPSELNARLSFSFVHNASLDPRDGNERTFAISEIVDVCNESRYISGD